jgi:dephospho-CoA kinase
MSDILRVGVTGGIGSGKSLVCSIFTRSGVTVLSADAIAKRVMLDDEKLRRSLVKVLGPSMYTVDGQLDRPYVANKIFNHPLLQHKVNALVHPVVEAEVERQFARLAGAGEKLAMVEAALIYEAGFHKRLDLVVVVDAPEATRIARVVARDEVKPLEVRKRIRAQLPVQSKISRADYVIRNSGSVEDLEVSVKFVLSILHHIVGKQ